MKRSYYLKTIKIMCLCGLLFPSLVLAEQERLLNEDDWSRPRSARVVKDFIAIQETVQAWMKDTKKQRIELRYPGGEDGNLWALELQDWLIALGIPSQKIEIYPGHPRQGELALVVLP